MARKKSSSELNVEIMQAKEQLKKLQKEQRIRKREEDAEREMIERQKQIEESLNLIRIAKQLMVDHNGQSITVYDWLKRESLRGESPLKSGGLC